jgi:type I restriction enzyme S subunit
MDAKTFLEEFETIAEAPGGIAKLRELILQLAVQGKLVPQDPNDEPASVLLERIATEKAQLVKEGQIKKEKPLPAVIEEDMLFDVPQGWDWARLGSLTQKLGAGSTPRGGKAVYKTHGIKFLRSQNVWNQGLILEGVAFIDESTHTRMINTRVMPYDILLNITGASIGRSALVPDDFDEANVSQHVAIVRPVLIETRYFIHLCLISPFIQNTIMDVQVGISREGLSMNRLREFFVPMPPLAEQHRIVAQVDELMALCDQLEERQTQRNTTRKALQESALDALANAETPDELASAWKRIRSHWDVVTAQPDSIDTLRQAILQLAVRGKLVAQDPNDEPASMLLERIEAEKARFVKTKKTKQSALPKLSNDELPFEAPEGWVWVHFYEVATIRSNLVNPKKFPNYPHIAPNHIEKGTGKLFPYKSVLEDRVTSNKHHFFPSQILYSKIRPNLSKVIIVNFEGLCSADMYPIETKLNARFVQLYMLSNTFLDIVTQDDNRIAMPKVNQEQLSAVVTPVPPLAEQHRIVAKVDELMAICDELEARLQTQQDTASELASASVHALAG